MREGSHHRAQGATAEAGSATACSQDKTVYLEAAEEVKDVELCLGDRYAVVPQGDADDDGVVPDFNDPDPKKQRVN